MQFEVFDNPIPGARQAFPFVAILQSDLADTGRERMVAPLVPRERIPAAIGRLTPIVKILGTDHLLLVPQMSSIAVGSLRDPRDRLTVYRDAILSALDILFMGV